MATLQIRELPEPIYQKLREQADKEFRSLSQQAIITLSRGLGLVEDLKFRRKEIIERITEEPVVDDDINLPDPVKLIREDRDR